MADEDGFCVVHFSAFVRGFALEEGTDFFSSSGRQKEKYRAMNCMVLSGSQGVRSERINTGVGLPVNGVEVIVS